LLSITKTSTKNFQTHGVSFIAVLRTAAVMGCHDRRRLSMQYSYRAQNDTKRQPLYHHCQMLSTLIP